MGGNSGCHGMLAKGCDADEQAGHGSDRWWTGQKPPQFPGGTVLSDDCDMSFSLRLLRSVIVAW